MTPQERKVMELALEALEGLKSLYGGNGHKLHEINAIHRNHDTAITALKEDLAQPEPEPVAYCEIHYLPEPCAQCAKEHEGYNTPPQRTEQEPVAHFGSAYINENGVHITTVLGPVAIQQDAKLYTTPPQRKPLPREVIDRDFHGRIDFVRQVEAAHGIKE